MRQWTREQLHRPYSSYAAEERVRLRIQQQQSRYRLAYHIQPETGLLNDPNGFAFFNGQWQLFYQHFPFGPVHGLKSWQHITSPDLTHWSHPHTALLPHPPYTTDGVFSGSAIPVGERLFLMYTGNIHPIGQSRQSAQLGAWMTADGEIIELEQPLISQPPMGYTGHFRDPQIIQIDGDYYALVGAQSRDKIGEILLYHATAVEGPWQLVGPIKWPHAPLGYMLECPNLAFIDDKVVLIFCPQGLDQNVLAYKNRFPNTYLVADGIDWLTGELINPGPLVQLDAGFDGYATQVTKVDGTVYAISWLGIPDGTYPTDREGWQGCLSLVKKLTLVDGQLNQTPVVTNLVGEAFNPMAENLAGQAMIQFVVPAGTEGEISLGNDHERLKLMVSAEELTVDRSHSGVPVNPGYGGHRTISWDQKAHQLMLFLDHSCFELFIDKGTQVMSGRIFPETNDWRVHAPVEVETHANRIKTI
ncbi:sucrose-6-phosphate hydrolase [Lacticaseibacillus brantae]|uniref:Sucrose-6-phosphate hydrolase n=1 Tax=Lacticaseibacillus brantae DSM 23927 TaxID=1423727 RepID=A0A0R2AXC4_9LACO|nr:sucrose-6-phosphate hydrolase [Lacticaseibacillus brantae]KRM71680.1 sucrose-6-phosphate hydrolase [Lacticaseibacillus brantae DSM 23927]